MSACLYCQIEFTPVPPRRRVCPACCAQRDRKLKAAKPVKPVKPQRKKRVKVRPLTPFTAGLAQFKALREEFLAERMRILYQPGDFMQRMADLDECEIAYRQDKLRIFQALPPAIRQRVWRRVLMGRL